MILIADSGSTKTDWRLIDEKKQIHQYATQGINPYFQSPDDILTILQTELIPQLTANIQAVQPEIYFYGAGCGTVSKKEVVGSALSHQFKTSRLEVHSDLVGAARALCGRKPGIVAIMGTGSNTCYYDGVAIIENSPSLGYILGDEGSGAHLGKLFIQAYLNKEVPEQVAKQFYNRFKLEKDEILDCLYKQPMPNRFLASFSKYIYQNLKEQFFMDLVVTSFNQFFVKHVLKYEHSLLTLNCVGSVAFFYSNILRAVALNKGVHIDKIIETPIAGLSLYHLNEE